LKEVDGERQFPILIGIFEATSIDRRVKSPAHPPRPLTHDLIVSIAEALGAEMESVVISELHEQTYFAQLRLRYPTIQKTRRKARIHFSLVARLNPIPY
jgi:bifunctional DNase/RNase